MFVFQPTLVLSWKSKGLYNFKLKTLYTAFLHSIKLSEYRIGIKFDKDSSTVEENSYLTKIVNVYDLDHWPRNPTNNLKFKNCFFRATNMVNKEKYVYSDKEKYVYSGHEITFDSTDSWSFGYDFARNVIILGVDNSSSSHSDNCKNNFLVLGEGPTY